MKPEINEIIKKHVLGYYSKLELKQQVEYMKKRPYEVGNDLVNGGCLLFWNEDIILFLTNECGFSCATVEIYYKEGRLLEIYAELVAHATESIFLA